MLNRLFGWVQGKEKPPITYDEEKDLAKDGDVELRADLASREDARPEILYFLAEDKSVKVRRQVARNTATPRQADKILARDVDDEVRMDLARKIGRLIPGLSERESEKLQELTFEVLDILARDQLPRVRQIVSEEIKHAINVPPDIIKRLSRDVEHIVAAPILEYSMLLSDHDLLDVIASAAMSGVLASISRRRNVSEEVCDAIVTANDPQAVAALLSNPSAQIREETLDSLIERAPDEGAWHEPLVRRPSLSQRALMRIAGFVASSLLSILEERHDLEPETRKSVVQAVRRRVKEEGSEAPVAGPKKQETDDEARKRAVELHRKGKLDDETVRSAAEMGQRTFLHHALALRSRLEPAVVEQIARSQSSRAITALTWSAGLAMRTAMALQKHYARLPSAAILNARNGVAYPLTEEVMSWYIDYFEANPAGK